MENLERPKKDNGRNSRRIISQARTPPWPLSIVSEHRTQHRKGRSAASASAEHSAWSLMKMLSAARFLLDSFSFLSSLWNQATEEPERGKQSFFQRFWLTTQEGALPLLPLARIQVCVFFLEQLLSPPSGGARSMHLHSRPSTPWPLILSSPKLSLFSAPCHRTERAAPSEDVTVTSSGEERLWGQVGSFTSRQSLQTGHPGYRGEVGVGIKGRQNR